MGERGWEGEGGGRLTKVGKPQPNLMVGWGQSRVRGDLVLGGGVGRATVYVLAEAEFFWFYQRERYPRRALAMALALCRVDGERRLLTSAREMSHVEKRS